jgi:hypothetical protein
MKLDLKLWNLPPITFVFLRGIRIGISRAEWIENTKERPENAEFTAHYTELYFLPPLFTSIKSKLCLWGTPKSDLPAFTFFTVRSWLSPYTSIQHSCRPWLLW